MTKDILDELFVDEGEINKELVHQLLVKYIRITKEGGIIPLEQYNSLSNEKKIMLILLAKRVFAMKGISSDFASPKEIHDMSGLPSGTVNPTLRSLEDRRILLNESGKYKIPTHAITKLRALLSEENEGTSKGEKRQKAKKKNKVKTEEKTGKYTPIIKQLIDDGFFKEGENRTLEEIIKRLRERGHSIQGRKVGALANSLTQMCRDRTIPLERKEVPLEERKNNEKWVFFKTNTS